MKSKQLIICIIIILIFSGLINFSTAQQNTGLEKETEQIQETVKKIPITETGEIDVEKVQLYKSKAEERIEKINQWLEKYASFFKFLFGMKPEVSWRFALNLFLIGMIVNIFVFVIPSFYTILDQKYSMIIGGLISLFIINTGTLVRITDIVLLAVSKWWVKLIIIFVLIFIIALMIFIRVKLIEFEDAAKEMIKKIKQEGQIEAAEEFAKYAYMS